jgi:hypothetical protein
MSTDVDLFDGLTDTDPTESTESTETPDSQNENESSETENTGTEDAPVETVDSVPAGAVSVTQFAATLSQHLMRQAFENDQEFDGSEYVVPQSVYQTVRAQKDRIPHVLVRSEGDSEARVYILAEPAIAWWMARRERLATRGTGTGSASNRTPEQNLTLLSAAVEKELYANSRLAMWQERAAQAEKLVEKYKGFLKDANVSEDTVALAVQEATDAFNAEQAAKAAEKAKKTTKAKDGEAVNAE